MDVDIRIFQRGILEIRRRIKSYEIWINTL